MSRVLRGCRFLSSVSKPKVAPSKAPQVASKPSNVSKEMPVSPAMREFLGVAQISRGGAVKKVWDHVKLHNLQNPANKREIFCDESLKKLFGSKDKVGMLEVAKLLTVHFFKP